MTFIYTVNLGIAVPSHLMHRQSARESPSRVTLCT